MSQRPGLLLALALFALAVLYVPWTWSDALASLGGDSAVYVLSARHYSPFTPADTVAALAAATSQFPPLYPLWLAPVAASLPLAHLATALAALLALAAVYAWMRAIGVALAPSLLAVVGFGVLPGTWLMLLNLHSEPLYLAASAVALAAMSRTQEAARDGGERAGWIAAAAIAATLLTRTAGLTLLPAFALVLWRARPARAPLMLAAAVAPGAVWSVLHGMSYGGTFVSRYAGQSAAQVIESMASQLGALVAGAAQLFAPSNALLPVLGVLFVLWLPVQLLRLVRLAPDAWYLAAYAGLITVWPFVSESARFAWVALPVMLGQLAWAGGHAVATATPALRQSLSIAPLAAALLVAAPATSGMAQRWVQLPRDVPEVTRHLPEWYESADPREALDQARSHLLLAEALKRIAPSVPEGECVYAIKPALVSFYAGREGRAPPREAVPEAEFRAGIAGCKYFALLPLSSPSYSAAYYPGARLGEELEPLAALRLPGAAPDSPPLLVLARKR